MKRFFLLICSLFLCANSFSQGEFNNWYFGFNCGITFNTNPPTATTNGAVNISDQTSTISDAAGNLIMYSDGLHVYNRNHIQMSNGFDLLGPSVTMSHASVIIRKPGSNNLYYIFTLTYFAYPAGFKYAIIDMNLQGGNGDVISKNNSLLTPVCEGLTAIRHQNGVDVWIIIHKWNTNAFYAYLLTSAGISAPVITNIGPIPSGSTNNAAGQFAASPDGTRLACATYDLGYFEIYDFNKTTGAISNQIQISGYPRSWGVQFSPDGTKLYATQWTYAPVYQFDLLAGNATAIANSATVVGITTSPNPGYKAGFMQLASDNKIYIAKMDADYVSVINNPDATGAACNFVDNGLYLAGKTCQAGLPFHIITSWVNPDFSFQNVCQGENVLIQSQNLSGVSSYSWNFGDPASGVNNISTQMNPSHFYSNPGNYTISLFTQQGSVFDTIQHIVTINPLPQVNLGNDTILCTNPNIVLNAGNPGGTFLWSNGQTTQSITVNSSGTYWVSVSNGNCFNSDTIDINFQPLNVDIGNDTVICGAISYSINAGNPGSTYLWSTGETIQIISVSNNGVYWVSVNNSTCSAVDTIHVLFSQPPTIDLGNDTILCPRNSIQLNAGNPGANYNWSTGSNSQSITINQTGSYWIEVEVGNCSVSDTIIVNIVPKLYLGGIASLCNRDEIKLSVPANATTYIWSTGNPNSTISITEPGSYWLIAEINNCTMTDTIVVEGAITSFYIPNAFTPNGDRVNDLYGPVCAGMSEYHFMIFSGWGELIFETNDVDQWWDGNYENKTAKDGVYVWALEYNTACEKGKRKYGCVTVIR